MKYIVYCIIFAFWLLSTSFGLVSAKTYEVDTKDFNVTTNDIGKGANIDKNTGDTTNKLKELLYGTSTGQALVMNGGSEIKTTAGLKDAGFKIVRSIKNIVILLAWTVLIVLVLRLIASGTTEEEVKRLKSGIVGIAIGIFLMQTAAMLVGFFLDEKSIDWQVAYRIYENILAPLAQFLMTFGQIAFLFMATWAALRLATAAGRDEKIKSAKMMLTSAIVGFLLLQLPKVIVKMFYGNPEIQGDEIELNPDMSGIASVLADILRYINGFLALAIVLMIIYAGAKMALSGGDEESLKKAKAMVVYIIVGCVLLVASFGFLQLVLTGVIPL